MSKAHHHTGAKDELMSTGCAKSFVMICFDFLRCIGSALYFLDFESTLYKTQSA